jgi:histidinol-phosphate aminotransferase
VRTQKTRLTIRKFVLNAPNSVFFESDDGYIRLNHNETTGLISPKLAKKIVSEDLHSLSEYPSYEKLHASIAKYAGVSSDMVHTTNGSDDAIPKITRMFFDESAEVILTVPTFPTYERALRIENVPFRAIPYEVDDTAFKFPLEVVLNALKSKDVQGLVICNPSNPLGVGIDKKTIQILADACKRKSIPLVIDEAYLEFHNVSGVSLLKTHPNVVILRTFSKTFGLAGLRLGYVLAVPSVITSLKKLSLPWEVNHTAVRAGLAVLENKKHFLEELKRTIARREEMRSLFKRYGVKTLASKANFIVCKTPHMNSLVATLKKHKIVVKSMSPGSAYLPYLSDCFRISVPGPDIEKVAFKYLLSALKEFSKLHAS